MASSRVGAMISASGSAAWERRSASPSSVGAIASPKATVFPEPVCAETSKSRPAVLASRTASCTAVGAEYAYKDGGIGNKGYNWLGVLTYGFTDKVSSAFRISGEKLNDGGPGFTKYTIAPGYAVTDKLTVRAEVSYYDYTRYGTDHATFYGVQAFFKF